MAIDKNDLESLAREKADEIIYRQKIQELSSAVTDVIRVLPNSLQELRYALELIDKNNENEFLKLKEHDTLSLRKLDELKRDIDELFEKIRSIKDSSDSDSLQRIVDKNDNNSLINQIDRLSGTLKREISDKNNPLSVVSVLELNFLGQSVKLTDLNNEKSLISLMTKQTQSIMKDIDKKFNTRSIVTWVLVSITSIVSIISSVGII